MCTQHQGQTLLAIAVDDLWPGHVPLPSLPLPIEQLPSPKWLRTVGCCCAAWLAQAGQLLRLLMVLQSLLLLLLVVLLVQRTLLLHLAPG